MLNTHNYEIEYFIELLRSAVRSTQPPMPKQELDRDKLFILAKKQQVYNTILPALEQTGILSDEELSSWNNYKLTELKKTIVVDNEREKICAELDEKNIKYMFLKGLETRSYYPKSSMRQMSDNDIFYDKSRRDDLVSIMKKNGFYLGTSAGISDDFYKKPFCAFEFHRTLFSPEEDFCPEFNPWINSTKVENTSRYRISREDNYIYTLCHLYKHYHCIDGCGVRFLCDLYLLIHSDDVLDFDYINKTFESFGVADFHKTALGLAQTLFGDGVCDDEQQALFDFMITGSVYGIGKNKVQDKLDELGGSKVKYIIHRIFPPVKQMKGNYKVLNKKPYLLPLYYVIRLFEKAIHNNSVLKAEIKQLNLSKKDK